MKKLTRILASTAFLGTTMLSTGAYALDSDVDATANFLPAITLTVNQILDFGNVEYTGTPSGLISLATNDTVTYGTGITGDAVGIAGEVLLTGNTTSIVDVSCDDTSAAVKFGVNSLNLQATEIIMGTGNGTTALAANDCAGLGTSPVSHTITATAADNTIMVGGAIDTNSGTVTTGVYTSTISTNFMSVRVLYQ